MMSAAVDLLIVQSLAGSGVILLTLLVRRAWSHRVSARFMYALWLLAAIRLALPLELPGIALGGYCNGDMYECTARQVTLVEQSEAGTAMRYDDRANAAQPLDASLYGSNVTSAAHGTGLRGKSAPEPDDMAGARPSGKAVVGYIWVAGMLATAGYMLATNRRWSRAACRNARFIMAYGRLPVYHADVDSPCLAGLFRLRIYVNARAEAPDTLRYVLAHESMHARAGDNVWKLLRNALCAVYWFDPLVWLAAAAVARDCESACDERVTRTLSRGEAIEYARTLVMLCAPQTMQPYAVNQMSAAKGEIMMRVSRILYAPVAKRWVCCTLAVALALTSVVSFATGDVRAEVIAVPETFKEMPAYSTAAGRLLVLTDGKLYQERGANWQLVGEYPAATAVADTAQGAFICETVGPQTTAVGALDEAAGDVLTRLESDGTRAESFQLPAGMRVRHMAGAGEYLVLTVDMLGVDPDVEAYMPHGGELYALDARDGVLEQLSDRYILDMSVDSAGNIYVVYEDEYEYTWRIACISGRDGEWRQLTEVVPMSLRSMAPADEGIYFCDDSGNIACLRPDDGQIQRIVNAAALGTASYVDVQYYRGFVYAVGFDVDAGNWSLTRFDLDTAAGGKRTLTIANYKGADTARGNYMLRWFEERYPDAELSLITVESAQLATRLMAGDSDIDIVYADAASTIGRYARSGAYLALDDMPGLCSAMEAAGFMDCGPALTYAGRRYGVPDMVMLYALALNEPLLDALGLEWPEAPYSWSELADWAMPALNGTEYRLIDCQALDPVMHYIDMALQREGEVRLDTAVFRDTMDAYRRLAQAGMLEYEPDSGKALASVEVLAMGAYAPLPTLEGNVANETQINCFYVSAGTDDRDLAEAYLTEYVSPDCQYSAEYGYPYSMLLHDVSGYRRGRPGDEAVDYRDSTEELRIQGHDAIVLRGRDLALNMACNDGPELDAYLSGQLDMDEYIGRVQPRLDMIQYE